MSNFNYEKAYFVQALPAFEGMNVNQKSVHAKLLPMVKDLHQQRSDLSIPMSAEMRAVMENLTCQELAELSRASYYVGYWKPGLVSPVFNNSSGESWKITNVCDQVLRARFSPLPHNILIHEGKLRVTFSNKDCWLWDEFGLATEKNLEIFKSCGLRFGESTLDKSAKKLADMCGDLWGDVDDEMDNQEYVDFLKLKQAHSLVKLKERHADRLLKIEKDIEGSKVKLAAFTWLIENGIPEKYIENCIYYSHTGRFCFGWRKGLSESERSELGGLLCEFLFDYDME